MGTIPKISPDPEPDLTAYETQPIIEDPDLTCDWCGDEADVCEQGADVPGPIRDYGKRGKMHAGCAWSSEHGGLATVVQQHGTGPMEYIKDRPIGMKQRDLDPAEEAELSQLENDSQGLDPPWWTYR